ncbi:MAG: DUF3822 family protein [Prevotellaceae bacterium]|jgi:hypothetical protein|nr:DUF3822 family protein [Prevotellaceae bacterium]
MPKFVSHLFTSGQSEQCNLSIQADLNGFYFYISDSITGKCYAFNKYTYTACDYNALDHEIHNLFQQEPLLTQRYKNCFCLFVSNKSILIPSSLFHPNHLRTYLEFVVPFDELDEIHYKSLPAFDAVNVFTIPGPLANIIHRHQARAVFFNQHIPLIHLLSKQQPHNAILLHVSHAQASFAVYAEGRFVLSNTFSAETFTDALYYLGYILKQWKLYPENTTVYLSGIVSNDDATLLQRYYPNIQNLYHNEIAGISGRSAGMEFQLLPLLSVCE